MKYFILRMRIIHVILIGIIFISLSCNGKDNVKPSQDSLVTNEALNNINIIKTAYQQKHRDTLQGHLGDALAGDILKRLFFEKAELAITPSMVRIEGSTVMVDTNWQGLWVLRSEKLKDRGVATFVFNGSPMMLIRVDGDNPFLVPLLKE